MVEVDSDWYSPCSGQGFPRHKSGWLCVPLELSRFSQVARSTANLYYNKKEKKRKKKTNYQSPYISTEPAIEGILIPPN